MRGKKRERKTNRQVLESKCKNKAQIQRELRGEKRQMCVCEKERVSDRDRQKKKVNV